MNTRMNSWKMVGGAVIAVLCASSAGAGSVLYVDDSTPAGGDGASWSTAYRFLQDALAHAAEPASGISEIRVGQGTYRPDEDEANTNGTGDRSATFQLINNVAIMGGYAGLGASDPDARDIEKYETILSGDLGQDDGSDFENYEENSWHVTNGSGTSNAASIDGFTITAGNADTSGDSSIGGGLFIQSGSPAVAHCTFSVNTGDWAAGVFNEDDSHPIFFECTFVNNAALGGSSRGGGLYSREGSTPNLMNCQFISNSAVHGGAINCENKGGAIINSCTFLENNAQFGGGIRVSSDSAVTVTNSAFIGNFADDDGGGMFDLGTGSSISGCTFEANYAADDGGGLYSGSSNVSLCLFEDNTCGSNGGAVYVRAEYDLLLTDCELSHNNAQIGGAIYCRSSAAVFDGLFIDQNHAGIGGALYVVNADASFNTSTIRLNTAALGGGLFLDDASPTFNNCFIEENNASLTGGGAYIDMGNPVFASCTFQFNDTHEQFGGGGGMYNLAGDPVLMECEFRDNVAGGPPSGGPGGGMYNFSGSPLIVDCLFEDQLALYGAGMLNELSDPVILGSTFASNDLFTSNENEGVGMLNLMSSPIIADCRFVENRIGSRGGGMLNDMSSPTIVNSVFAYNIALIELSLGKRAPGLGGALFNRMSDPMLVNTTISANMLSDVEGGSGGGIYNEASSPTLANCIVWNNDEEEIFDDADSTTTVTYSDIEGGWPGEGNIDADPLFVDPSDDGLDFRLTAGSPAIDAGDNSAVPDDVTTDLDGNPRFVNDPMTPDTGLGPAPIVDMGAFEFQIESCYADLDRSGDVGFADLLIVLDSWGECLDPKAKCTGDLDGDFIVGFADLLLLLDAWGPCN